MNSHLEQEWQDERARSQSEVQQLEVSSGRVRREHASAARSFVDGVRRTEAERAQEEAWVLQGAELRLEDAAEGQRRAMERAAQESGCLVETRQLLQAALHEQNEYSGRYHECLDRAGYEARVAQRELDAISASKS